MTGQSSFRIAIGALGVLCLLLCGCPKSDSTSAGDSSSAASTRTLDGAYHATGTVPMVLDFKGNKCKVTLAGEIKELNYKIEADTVIVMDPTEGNMLLTINSDGTLTGPGGTFSKK